MCSSFRFTDSLQRLLQGALETFLTPKCSGDLHTTAAGHMLNKQLNLPHFLSVINLIVSIKRKLETSSCQVRQCFCVQDLFTTDMWIMLIIWKVHNRTKLRSSAICIQHMHDDRYYHPDEAIWGFVWLGGWSLSLTKGYVFFEPFLLMNCSDLSEQEIVLLPKVGGGRCPVHKEIQHFILFCMFS